MILKDEDIDAGEVGDEMILERKKDVRIYIRYLWCVDHHHHCPACQLIFRLEKMANTMVKRKIPSKLLHFQRRYSEQIWNPSA